jgi:hypothetical protein
MRPDLVSAISVTAHVDVGRVEEIRLLRELSQHLGHEFGFDVSVTVGEASISVRFARRCGGASDGEAHR